MSAVTRESSCVFKDLGIWNERGKDACIAVWLGPDGASVKVRRRRNWLGGWPQIMRAGVSGYTWIQGGITTATETQRSRTVSTTARPSEQSSTSITIRFGYRRCSIRLLLFPGIPQRVSVTTEAGEGDSERPGHSASRTSLDLSASLVCLPWGSPLRGYAGTRRK